MKTYSSWIVIIVFLLLQACSSSKTQTFWVSGIQTKCPAGEGEMHCLAIYEGEQPDTADWQFFYDPIEGFTFREGYLRKIKVRKEKTEPVPADASAYNYTLIKQIDSIPDPRIHLQGEWTLTKWKETEPDEKIVRPVLKIDLQQMQISGNGGCNEYSGPIKKLNAHTMALGNIFSTAKACFRPHLEQEYYAAISEELAYQLKGDTLQFYSLEGESLMTFTKNKKPNIRLHDIWVVTSLLDQPIKDKSLAPRMEFNLTRQTVYGSDGCNQYSGEIKSVTDTRLQLGKLITSSKACDEMKVADRFQELISKVSTYELKERNLFLMDQQGNQLMQLLKVD